MFGRWPKDFLDSAVAGLVASLFAKYLVHQSLDLAVVKLPVLNDVPWVQGGVEAGKMHTAAHVHARFRVQIYTDRCELIAHWLAADPANAVVSFRLAPRRFLDF